MADMKAMLTKKLGPLPAWGWGVVIGGGYLGYRLISGRGLSMPAASARESDADTSGMTAGGTSGTGSSDPYGSYASGQQGSLLDAYMAGEATGLSLIPAPAINPDGPTPTPQPGNPPTAEPIKLAPTPKLKPHSSNGWKIWGVHWKDIAKHRASTSAGRKNTAAYKAGQAANKAKRAAKTKRTGTSQSGFIKQKPRVVTPPHRNDTKRKVAAKPAPKKVVPRGVAAKPSRRKR